MSTPSIPPVETHRLGDGESVGVVYHCIDADGRSLYVGQSIRVDKRFIAHRCVASWWTDVARIELFEVRDNRTLDEVERSLIADTRPVHNRLHNPDWEWSYARRNWVPIGTVAEDSGIARARWAPLTGNGIREAIRSNSRRNRERRAAEGPRTGADVVPIRAAS